jgi:X-Pro dipeptidyl-peptidase
VGVAPWSGEAAGWGEDLAVSPTRPWSSPARVLLAAALTVVLLLSLAPSIGAQEAAGDGPERWMSTDPSAEEGAGRLDAPDVEQPESQLEPRLRMFAEPDGIVVENDMTQPVFSYETAIRESVKIPGAVASEDSGQADVLHVDIIRPAASEGELDVPTIIVPSPYYQGPGRGRAAETKRSGPVVTAGDLEVGGALMSGSVAVAGQRGLLVDCGRALTPADCPADSEGAVALVERGGATFSAKGQNVAAAGAVGAIVYNDTSGSFSGSVSGVPIPVMSMARADGLSLQGLADGTTTATMHPAPPSVDFFPLYYDNYFVPRGYAVALLDLAGTRGSTGCLDIGGPAEIDNTARFVEWLHGEGVAHDSDGNEISADWSNGLSAMVGKSWDGTVANGVAARGVEGLATIVPITAISSWHKYYWENGVGYAGSPLNLANNIRNVPAARCTQTNAMLATGGANPDPTTAFWQERNYVTDADKVEASVFVVHGLNDYNVKPHNYSEWWDALAEHDVPRKIWLSQVAHEKGFDFRRDEWLTTINRWFDHWLHGIDNGIMDEPMADVEYAPDQWATYDTWPGGTPTVLLPGQPGGGDDPRPGTLSLNRRNLQPKTQVFRETRQSATAAVVNGFADRGDRLVFMTDELTAPVRVSGTSTVSLRISVDDPSAILSAYLVDYGTAERTQHTIQGGILDLASVSCFGQGTVTDTGCYRDVVRRVHSQPQELVARGWADARFLTGEAQLQPGEDYRLEWEIFADDYVFEAGHRIGVVITGSDTATRDPYPSSSRGDVTVHLNGSRVELPVVGGPKALRDATR